MISANKPLPLINATPAGPSDRCPAAQTDARRARGPPRHVEPGPADGVRAARPGVGLARLVAGRLPGAGPVTRADREDVPVAAVLRTAGGQLEAAVSQRCRAAQLAARGEGDLE